MITIQRALLCRPTHYSVDYAINPWMQPGSVNAERAMEQWNQLVQTYRTHGIEVEIIEQSPDLPDMVFATDQAIILPSNTTLKTSETAEYFLNFSTTSDSKHLSQQENYCKLIPNKHALLSNFRHPERQGETKFYHQWLREQGYEIKTLPQDILFEGGGEYQIWRNSLFIGHGFRTDPRAPELVSQMLNIEVIGLHLIDEKFYHLDTCLFVLDAHTIFYYPPAFDVASREILLQLVPKLIEISTPEVLNFAANSLVSGNTVFMQTGSPMFKQQIQDLGYQAVEVDISEFMKAGGGIHCLTLILESELNLAQPIQLKTKIQIRENAH